MPPAAATVWAGIDVGKTHHWVEVVDDDGATLLSRRVLNDQVEIDALIATILPLAETVLWAVDIVGCAETYPSSTRAPTWPATWPC